MTGDLNQQKADFIDYLLFNYRFKSRISVWVLNYIKTLPNLLEHVHFVDQVITTHSTLYLSVKDSDQIGIQFKYGTQLYKNTNEIFYIIANERPKFDIKLYFKPYANRDKRLDQLLVTQLLHSPQYAPYVTDLYEIALTPKFEAMVIDNLKQRIDLSLRLNEEELFYQYTHLLNTLYARTLQANSKDV